MGGEMMKKGVSREREEAMEKMTERLSCKDNLYFPRALEATATTPPQRKSILLDLLSRDPAVFLGTLFSNPNFLFVSSQTQSIFFCDFIFID